MEKSWGDLVKQERDKNLHLCTQMIAELNQIYNEAVQLDGGIDPLSVFEQWRSKYATILGTESPTQKRTTMPFVDLYKIKWSEAQIDIEANTALPSELQL